MHDWTFPSTLGIQNPFLLFQSSMPSTCADSNILHSIDSPGAILGSSSDCGAIPSGSVDLENAL